MLTVRLNSSRPRYRQRFGGWLSARLARWVRQRQGAEQLPVTLRAKRIYILPTGIGVTFAIVCFAMLLGSMNYNNSMGFALTFLLVATGLTAMHRCHQNLVGLVIAGWHADGAFAGDAVRVHFLLANPGSSERLDIRARLGSELSAHTDIGAQGDSTVTVDLPTERRGPMALPRLALHTEYPFSLLHSWAWLHLDQQLLIWPTPAADAPARPLTLNDRQGARHGRGDDDFAGLRDYRDGDGARRIAWKTYARSDELKTRQFEGGSASTNWIDFDALSDRDAERKLSILCRWVLDAAHQGEAYGLRLPGLTIEPAQGLAHRNRCLDALASYGALR